MPSIADDYAVARLGDLYAYYGYEYNYPDGDLDEWGFYVKRGKDVLCRIPYSEIRLEKLAFDRFDTAECLLAGLEMFWERMGDEATKTIRSEEMRNQDRL